MTAEDKGGKFTTRFRYQDDSYAVSVEADGYKPAKYREIMLTEQDAEYMSEIRKKMRLILSTYHSDLLIDEDNWPGPINGGWSEPQIIVQNK